MPSPVGHALGAVTCGWIAARPYATSRALLVQAAVLAVVGMAPDLDLLVHHHRAQSHSIGAAAIVASIAAWQRWPVGPRRWRIWCAVFLAWASHPLLDALGEDTAVPLGVMAFWPLTHDYFLTHWDLFSPVSRSWRSPTFVAYNTRALIREVALLGPLAAATWWLRRFRNKDGVNHGDPPAAR
ncbi:MAG: metal-dependent hydrolase [Vicinamibacterales bacterium]